MIPNHNLIRSILIIKPDALGDFIIFTGALREIRNFYRSAFIVLVCNKLAEPFCYTNPHIDHYITGFERNSDSIQKMDRILKLLKRSPNFPFDLTVVLRWDIDSYFAGYLASRVQSRVRVGFSERCTQDKQYYNHGYDSFYTHVLIDNNVEHESEKWPKLLTSIGVIVKSRAAELFFSKTDRNIFDRLSISSTAGYFVAAVGASITRQQLKPESWKKIIDISYKIHPDRKLILIGGPTDADLVPDHSDYPNVVDLVGLLNVRESAYLISRSVLLFCCDSSMKHIASVFNTPVVEFAAHSDQLPASSAHSKERFGARSDYYIRMQPMRFSGNCDAPSCSADESHCINSFDLESLDSALKHFS